jgi:hypothetical protein
MSTVINDVNDETEDIRARVPGVNKAYSSLQTIFRSKQNPSKQQDKTTQNIN